MSPRPLICLLLLGVAAEARAQNIADIWPPGARRGAKTKLQVEGSALAGARTVLISGTGVKAAIGAGTADGNTLALNVEVSADAGPGPYEVRVATPAGLSNPGYLWVGTCREIEEREPNNQQGEAMKLDDLPITVNGRVNGAEDVDWFQIHADAGDTVVFDICSNRLYAPLDPFLELRDMEGRLLGSAMEGYDRDPRLIHTFKKSGEYRLQVRDTLYRGGGNFIYRLTIGKIPVITSITPPGGRRGETLSAAVEGVNLGGMKTATITLPDSMPENRTTYLTVDTPNGPSLPFPVFADDMNQSPAPSAVTMLPRATLPASVTGRLSAAKEKHVLPFDAEAGKSYQIAVIARAVGSRMIPYLRILDGKGKELLNTEDQIGRDPRVSFSPPANGTYQLELSTIDSKGGADYVYRIRILPPSLSDFRITATPDNIPLGHGQTAMVTVGIDRLGGFGGPVDVHVSGLPAGVSVSPLSILPGQTSGILTLTASTDAAPAGLSLRIDGEAAITPSAGKGPLKHEAQIFANLPRPGEGQILPRPVTFIMATTTAAVPLFSLIPESTQISISPGQTVMIKVRTARRPNDNAALPAIALTLANLPPGVSADAPTIAEKQNEATLKLVAAPNATIGSQSALLTGKLGNETQPAPAILVTVKK